MVASLMSALPGSVAQGLIWGILAIGVYITYKVLDLLKLIWPVMIVPMSAMETNIL